MPTTVIEVESRRPPPKNLTQFVSTRDKETEATPAIEMRREERIRASLIASQDGQQVDSLPSFSPKSTLLQGSRWRKKGNCLNRFASNADPDLRSRRKIFIHTPLSRATMPPLFLHQGKAMDWRAANEQHDEARWRVFLMFVVMALMVIRTGLVSRGVIAVLSSESASPDAAWVNNHQSSSASPADLNQAILALLCLAEAAGRLLIVKERAVWDLINQPLPRPAQEQPLDVDSLFERPAQRLDTS